MAVHIYIVEDDKNIREIEMFALKNSGYAVEEFENAKSFFSRSVERSLIWYSWISCSQTWMVLRL